MSLRFVVLAFAGLAACGRAGVTPPGPARTNVLLVTLDTLRADRLGRGFTPALDRLASEGLRFTQARTVAPLTLPAHVSLFTGLLPPAHGVRLNGWPLPRGTPTIATRLKTAGYRTAAVVGAFVLDRRFGLDAGFDQYDDRIDRDPSATDVLQAERPAGVVVDRAVAVLDGTPATDPWFLWVHLYDAHAPYTPPADAMARAQGDPYNGEVAYVDAEFARLLARLDARPDAARTVVIVAGDHGESLGDHGEPTHGMLVFESALRVPLIVRAPGVAPAERTDAASLIDVAPSILALTGMEASDTPGRNLASGAADGVESYAESEYPTVAGWAPTRALVRDGWKVVVAGRARLFDLSADPSEASDQAGSEASLAQGMAARVEQIRRSGNDGASPGGPVTMSAETASRLRSLGYVASSPAPAPGAGGGVIDPGDAMADWAAFEGALAELAVGQPRQALPVLIRLADAYPASPLFTSTSARAMAAGGRGRDALARLRAAVKRWPGDWSLHHELAVVARDLGLSEEAMRAEDAALALEAREPSALNGKGLLLADAGRHAEAARAFESATEFDPTNAVYHANLGNARRALGELDRAADAYRRALDRSPALADAANGLGVVLVQQHRPADAVPWLQLAASDPAFVEAQLNLGIAYQQSGDLARAKAQYRKVAAAAAADARERDAARVLLERLEPR